MPESTSAATPAPDEGQRNASASGATQEGWSGSESKNLLGSRKPSTGSIPGMSSQASFRTATTEEIDAVTAPSTPNPAADATSGGGATFFGATSEHNESSETVNATQRTNDTAQSSASASGPATPTPISGAATPSAVPRRSVTITENRTATSRKQRRDERQAASHSEPAEQAAAAAGTADVKRSQSLSGVRRSLSGMRKSISMNRQSEGPVDVLREPRRSIGKRPEEFDLAARDPHSGATTKTVVRAVAFAAPYTRSGIVVSRPSHWSEWLVPGPLTFGHGQWWYLTAGQSLVAAIISGAINFGVACATYNHYDRDTPVRLWSWFPVPLAGDMGVTVIIQQIISHLLTSALVHHDLTNGPIGPLRRPWPPLLHLPSTPCPTGSWLGVKISSEVNPEKPLYMGKAEGKSKFVQGFWWFIRSFLTGSERNDLFAKGITWRQRLERILWTAIQGFVLCLLTFPWYWPISIAIVAPLYGGRNLSGTYIPAIIKLLYGAILSLLTNPVMALLAMGAESSVRRAYPELEIWQPFGGEEDYQAWLAEQHIPSTDVEIGPRGLARSSTQINRHAKRGSTGGGRASAHHTQELSNDSSVDLEAQRRMSSSHGHTAGSGSGNDGRATPTLRAASPVHGASAGPTALTGGRPVERAITEEPESAADPSRVPSS